MIHADFMYAFEYHIVDLLCIVAVDVTHPNFSNEVARGPATGPICLLMCSQMTVTVPSSSWGHMVLDTYAGFGEVLSTDEGIILEDFSVAVLLVTRD